MPDGLLCQWWGSNPHVLLAQGILSFGEGFPFGVIWSPLRKGKIHVSTNNNLKYPRFFDAFPLGSDFSIWKAKKKIGGMFRRDAEPVIQDCAHRLFFGKYFKPVQFWGRLIRIQNEATKPGAHPGSDHTISGNIYFDIANKPDRRVWLVCCSTEWAWRKSAPAFPAARRWYRTPEVARLGSSWWAILLVRL